MLIGVTAVLLGGCAAEAPIRREPPTAVQSVAPVLNPEPAEWERAGRQAEAPLPVPPGAATQRGQATFYSDRFAGRKTANGERYDPSALTAAHRTLPFGTVVDVARPDGRHVQVRINDRGPFGQNRRIIDLSRRAAEHIGIRGVGEVTIRVVSSPPSKAKSAHPRDRAAPTSPPGSRARARSFKVGRG
jgi:rare lipoprotein A